jgi:hypothetical protein
MNLRDYFRVEIIPIFQAHHANLQSEHRMNYKAAKTIQKSKPSYLICKNDILFVQDTPRNVPIGVLRPVWVRHAIRPR